jgi:hypothetical protein
VPHDPALPVTTAWDLGVHDSTAIWFAQVTRSGEWRMIDYIEDSGAGLDHYAQMLQQRAYMFNRHLLPHDAKIREMGSGKSRIETLAGLGIRPTRIVRTHSIADGINAVRMVLPRCYFDAVRCAKGIHALRHYRREWNEAAQAWRATPVHDHASHGCLTGNMLVQTDTGLRRIDTVRRGHRVWTPAGYAEVDAAGVVKRASELMLVKLADGRFLCCTPEHKIATKRGFVRADAIRYSDIVMSGKEWQSRLIGLFSRAGSTGYRATITAAITGERAGRPTFTVQYGSTITARFRKVVSFITAMAIRSTMPWPTLNASTSPSIRECTPWRDEREVSLKTQVSFVAGELPSGTPARRALSGTSRMASGNGKRSSGLTWFADSVVRYLLRRFLTGQSGVISIARWKTSDKDAERPLVYDLTVRDHACYQANGFLVSNSDAMRYLALGVREAGPPAAVGPTPGVVRDPILTGQWDTSVSSGNRVTNWMRA